MRWAGAALFPYVSTQRFPWFLADWGTMTVNSKAREGDALKRGDVLDFADRFVVHDGDVVWLWGELGERDINFRRKS